MKGKDFMGQPDGERLLKRLASRPVSFSNLILLVQQRSGTETTGVNKVGSTFTILTPQGQEFSSALFTIVPLASS